MTVLLGGCDYLGLARDPRVIEAACRAAHTYGASASASRATTGTLDVHLALEDALRAFLNVEDVALVADGALANQCAFDALAGQTVCYGSRCHPTLRSAGPEHAPSGTVFASDTVEPSDGWTLPLHSVPHDRTCVLDDCHGVAVMHAGIGVSGVLSEPARSRTIVTGTLAKALGSAGGFLAGPKDLIDRARASSIYVCTTSLSPMAAAAALASLQVLQSEPERLTQLHARSDRVAELLGCRQRPVPVFSLVGVTDRLLQSLSPDFKVPFVRYPVGPADGCFRLVVTMGMNDTQFDQLCDRLGAATTDYHVLDFRDGDAL